MSFLVLSLNNIPKKMKKMSRSDRMKIRKRRRLVGWGVSVAERRGKGTSGAVTGGKGSSLRQMKGRRSLQVEFLRVPESSSITLQVPKPGLVVSSKLNSGTAPYQNSLFGAP